MSDPTPEPDARSSQVCDEIGRAVGSLWQRRSGVRPNSVHTEYVKDVVRCTIDRNAEAEEDGEQAAESSLGAISYQRLAAVAVADLTGRTVTGFVAKRVKAGEPATNAFILEPIRTRH